MKKSSKILAVLLAASMMLSVIGCGKQEASGTESVAVKESESTANTAVSTEAQEDLYYNKTGYPICDEPITITVSGRQGTTTDWQNTVLVKTIEEKLGIKLVCEPIANDAFKTQYALMLSENDVPDLIIYSNISKAQGNLDGEAGYWLDLNEYMDLMPNFKAHLEKYPYLKAYLSTENGEIYSLSRNTASELTRTGTYICYDKALVESLGITEIKSVDDFYNALVAVKAAYPEKIPFAIGFNAGSYMRGDFVLANAFGMKTWTPSYAIYPNESGEVVLGATTENGRAHFSYLNKLYEEKLLDTESFLYTADEYKAKIDEGKFVFWCSDSLDYDNAISNKPEDFGIINALTSEYCEELTLVMDDGITEGARIMVSANTEYPEAICRLIDFLFTEEGIQLSTTGVEGETFEFVEDEKYGYKTVSYDKFADLKNFENATAWRNQQVVIFQGMAVYWDWESAWIDELSVETLEKMVADPDLAPAVKVKAMYKLAAESTENKVTILPPFVYTDEENTEISTLKTDITSFIETSKAAFVAGDMDVDDDKQWQSYLDTLNQMGLERLLNIEQAAYDRLNFD